MADFCGVRTAAGCCIVQIFDETCEQVVEKMADNDLVKRLRDDADYFGGRSLDRGNATEGMTANLLHEAADRIEALEEAARACAKVRVRLAAGLTPEGARYEYEQAIRALKEKE